MPIRNPFSKRPDLSSGTTTNEDSNRFEKVDTSGSRPSAMSIASSQKTEPTEYKMSVVDDSGAFVPPSPPEKKSFWPTKQRSNLSTTSTASRSSLAENEPFSISRESFDSYRRSFDISARSPVIPAELNSRGRRSLDAIPRLPRSAIGDRRFEREPPTAEEGFEEVGLNDENKQPAAQAAKKKGFFSKFGDTDQTPPQSPITSNSRFHLPGRKRGQSGQGAELGEISRPGTATPVVPEVKGT